MAPDLGNSIQLDPIAALHTSPLIFDGLFRPPGQPDVGLAVDGVGYGIGQGVGLVGFGYGFGGTLGDAS